MAGELAAAFSAEECFDGICIVLTQCCLLNFSWCVHVYYEVFCE